LIPAKEWWCSCPGGPSSILDTS